MCDLSAFDIKIETNRKKNEQNLRTAAYSGKWRSSTAIDIVLFEHRSLLHILLPIRGIDFAAKQMKNNNDDAADDDDSNNSSDENYNANGNNLQLMFEFEAKKNSAVSRDFIELARLVQNAHRPQ